MIKDLSSIGALAVFLLLSLSLPARAAEPGVVINEIAWMGTANSTNDEWIELYNNTETLINLDGWILKSGDGTPEIKLIGAIPAKGFYLLERTDDTAIPGVSADQIYTGALNNNGEKLELYDSSGNLIDGIDCSSGWFAGDNNTKQTMERKSGESGVGPGSDPVSWATSQNPGGTPKSQNSAGATAASAGPTPTENIESIETIEISAKPQKTEEDEPAKDGPPLTYPDGIVFNEIMPSPKGPDETEEWIEIFNQNDFEVELSGWKIADKAGKTNTYVFPKKTIIGSAGFLVLARQTTQIVLNNDADGLNLTRPDGQITDSVDYQKAALGRSYNKTKTGWNWSDSLTPERANIVSGSQAVQSGLEKNSEIKSQENKKLKAEDGLAAVGENISKSSGSLFIFLIALIVAGFSGAIILIVKKKMKTS